MAIGNIYFKHGTKEEYDLLEVKDSNTIYFIDDTKEIFKGEDRFSSGNSVVCKLDCNIYLQGGNDEDNLSNCFFTVPYGSTWQDVVSSNHNIMVRKSLGDEQVTPLFKINPLTQEVFCYAIDYNRYNAVSLVDGEDLSIVHSGDIVFDSSIKTYTSVD